MTQGTDLLRLLEPTVRPVSPVKPAAGTAGVKSGELPFEAQDFESLLSSVRETQDSGLPRDEGPNDANTQNRPPGPLDALADFGRIENPGLRELLAQQRGLTTNPETTTPNPAA
ncbi:MAG: hypothetical protein AAF593_04070 [Planctomycetota bacterium]